MAQWSCVVNDNATYRNYIGRVRIACFFYRLDTSWISPAVRRIARGLAKCQNKSFRFPNFIRSSLLLRIVEFEGFASEFAQVAYLSFLVSLRVPSETLMMRRAFPTDLIAEQTPQPDKALIKLATLDDRPYLVMKFSYGENLVYGCILRRPCFCPIATKHASALCPVHDFWPRIRARAHSGHSLYPEPHAKKH